jgi:hypothetical protein
MVQIFLFIGFYFTFCESRGFAFRAAAPPPQKATLGSAARLQAPSLTPHCRYQLFAG